jgi:hypothetical protein
VPVQRDAFPTTGLLIDQAECPSRLLPCGEKVRGRFTHPPQLSLSGLVEVSAGRITQLASLAAVEVVDMKGTYRDATVAMEPDPDLYRRVFEALPGAWIEDPAVADDTIELLDRHRERITWDVPIRSVGDIETLPWPPRLLNLKPARFGSVCRLFETYDYCEAQGISAYGGGMFELGPGRGQLQYLASLFHPDGPNDLAPVEYNLQLGAGDLPRPPLPPEPHETGFRWGSYDGRRSIRERPPQ